MEGRVGIYRGGFERITVQLRRSNIIFHLVVSFVNIKKSWSVAVVSACKQAKKKEREREIFRPLF